MAPALALQGFSAIFTAMLQIHGRFAGPAAVGVAFNAGIIIGVAIGQGTIGIGAAAWGVVLGATLQVLLQLPQFWRLLREAHARPVVRHPRLAAVGLLALPVVGASVLQQINSFTDKLFASTLEPGRVSALSFANALGQAPRVAILLPLLTPLFPLIARLVSEGREDDALRSFRRVAGLLGLMAIPLMLLMAIYADEIAQLAFQRGRSATWYCVDQIDPPLVWYALGLWPAFGSLLLNRTLSAANRQRDILWTTVVTVAITILLDVILLGPMEQAGLALAATIGVYANAVDAAGPHAAAVPGACRCGAMAAAPGPGVGRGAGAARRGAAAEPGVPDRGPRARIEMLPALIGKLLVAIARLRRTGQPVGPGRAARGDAGQVRSLRRARTGDGLRLATCRPRSSPAAPASSARTSATASSRRATGCICVNNLDTGTLENIEHIREPGVRLPPARHDRAPGGRRSRSTTSSTWRRPPARSTTCGCRCTR